MTFLPDFDKEQLSYKTPDELKTLAGQLEREIQSIEAKRTWLNEQLETVRAALGGK